MKDIKRKVDMETEKFDIWKVDKKEKKEVEKEEGLKIKYKDMEFKMLGFTIGKDEKTNEILFAFKVKPDEKLLLLYNPKKNKRLEKEFSRLCGIVGINMQDLFETMENIYIQRRSLEKL